jgi:hypothetical protein
MASGEPFYADDAVRALLDPRAPATSPALRLIQVAMSGFGYDFYDARNVARANDQLVRERMSDALGEASAALRKLEREYRDRNFPGATREQPLPPPDVMRGIRRFDAARTHCEAIASALLAAEAPATDAIWFRLRDEETLLHRLVACDVALATAGIALRERILALEAGTLDEGALGAVEADLAALDRALAERRALLRPR